MTTSPTKTKQKLSLRKRLFVKKSPKVGCYVDADSNDEFHHSSSRPISPADPFLAHSAHYADYHESVGDSPRNHSIEPINNTSNSAHHSQPEDENNPRCCRKFFSRSRPKSLLDHQTPQEEPHSREGSPCNNSNSLSDQTISCSQSKSEEIPKATIKFPKNDDPRMFFEHSGSFEGIKTKNKLFVKRLSADHLISNDSKPLYGSSSPESDRSNSLDRKRR